MGDERIALTINGEMVEVSPHHHDWTLLRYVREALGLTGTRQSCDNEGTCGACMVVVNGRARPACRERVGALNGARVETIEGIARDGELHPLQKAFVLRRVMQCGFATPGQIMTSKALLQTNPNPTREEVAEALRYNVSRCSAGYRAVDAVLLAAAAMRGGTTLEWDEPMAEANRLAVSKVTGALKYTDDLSLPGMLYGRAKRSDFPHARIERIDVEAARNMPDVVAVLTAKDVPGENRWGLLIPDQPVLCDTVVKMIGDAVALVVAESFEQAGAAVEKITVTYTPLPMLLDPREALKPNAMPLHRSRDDRHPNVLRHVVFRKGNVEEGFANADVVIEDDYSTPYQEHGYEELECSIGVPEEDGVAVYCGSQGPSFDQVQVARACGLPLEKVRIAHMPVGGAFGGREDVNTQVLAGVAAYVLKRPVKVKFTRYESLRAHHKRHPEFLHYKTGATRDGRLVALEATLYGDTGAYASTGEAVLFRSAAFAGGPYEIRHANVDAYAVFTNNVTCGAFRGFGSPQPAFAAEVQMEKLARALGMDSIEFRIKNALAIGRTTITGHTLTEDVGDGVRQCLEAVRDALQRTRMPTPGPDEHVGVGVSACYKNVGLGGGIPDSAGAIVHLQNDGTFLLRTGAAELGQGASEALLNIASATLGVSRGRIFLHMGDTRHDPPAGMTTASRTTFVSGNAVLTACEELREQIRDVVASEFNVEKDLVALQDGYAIRTDSGAPLISLADLASGDEPLKGEAHYDAPPTNPPPEWAAPVPSNEDIAKNKLHFAYSFGALAAIVTVHEKTGDVKVRHIVAAFDCGKAINRPGVEGQIEGGVIQGLGFATSERYHMIEGRPGVTTFAGMGLPQTPDLPTIETIVIENRHPLGPMGAKGMGEMPLTATAPAVVNAIHDAVSVWINELPVTREKVLAALRAKSANGGA